MLLLQSTFSSTQRVDRFGLELVDYLEAQEQQTAYLLNAILRDEEAHLFRDLGAPGILRQVAVQLLQTIRPQNAAEVLATTVERFQQSASDPEWFDTLIVLLEYVPCAWIVIDLALLGDRLGDAQTWPSDFQQLFDRLRAKGSSALLKVALLNCRDVLSGSVSAHVVSVPEMPTLPSMTRALQRQRLQEQGSNHHFQPPLHRPPQFEQSLTVSEPDTIALNGDVAAGGEKADSKQCQDWFAKMRAFQKCVDAFRKDPDEKCPRVKVAVLDTGVDLSHPEIAEARADERLLYHDFVDSADGIGDLDGHGTHCTSILLKHAPNAQVYSGRVFRRSRADKDSPVIVAKAISHAADVWKVDIISLSLGFESSAGVMRDAIRQACARNILIFAAAANNTTNEVTPIRFPARLDEPVMG
ncbi:hypothetical protein CDD83_2674 [Cordyceps sp. RAO-2017]|nr:hypothetical protein CDD83_2674 [Cordyceps sp. RAO-2017]